MRTTVRILATCRKPELLPAATLVFKTLRVGFPNADVRVDINACDQTTSSSIRDAAKAVGATAVDWSSGMAAGHDKGHAYWIQQKITEHKGGLVLLDSDIVFWKNCEWFDFDADLAGYGCPKFYSEFPAAITLPRLHTSFMWFRDAEQASAKIRRCTERYEHQFTPHCPFKPFVYEHEGQTYFQDTATGISRILGCAPFAPKHLECYDHLNCATVIDAIAPKMKGGEAMREFHKAVYGNPEILKGSWGRWANYYRERLVED